MSLDQVQNAFHPRGKSDRGVTFIFVALMLVVLMIFAAFAVDLGAVFNERRQDQSAVDAGATSAGVQFLRTGSFSVAVGEALDRVDQALERDVTDSEWAACEDPAPLDITAESLGLTPSTSCVSISAGFDRLRVYLPDQAVATSFGRVVGIDEFKSTAFAEVSLVAPGGGALPFVMFADAAAGDQVCLRTEPGAGSSEPPDQPTPDGYTPVGNEVDPCNSASFDVRDASLGTIKPYLYRGCSSGTGNESIVDGIMVGMDHLVGVFDPEKVLTAGDSSASLDFDPDARLDGGPSPSNCQTALPNTLRLDGGLTTGLLRCALLEQPCTAGTAATETKNGRLSSSTSGQRFAGLEINNTPLWDYFVDSLPAAAPAACGPARSSATEFYLRRAYLRDCLAEWAASGAGPLFKEEIGLEPRFGYVPRIAEVGLCDTQPDHEPPTSDPTCKSGSGDPNNGAIATVHVNNFSPVYIDGVYQQQTAVAVCDSANPAFDPLDATISEWAVHYPAQGGLSDCGTSAKVDRLSAIAVPCGALPPVVCDPSTTPSFPGVEGIIRVRLSK